MGYYRFFVIYLTLQHNSNKHKSKLFQWNLESAVKCMKILRDVIGTHIVTALAKPNPSWSQIRLGLELSNALEPTHPPPHRNSKLPISQPFLNGLSWNFAWWLSRWKGSSLESKDWPCSTAVFHAALQNLWLDHNSAIFYRIKLKFGMIRCK